MSAVDVLAVMDAATQSAVELERAAQNAVGFARAQKLDDLSLRCDRLDAATGYREDLQGARAAMAEAFDVLRLSAEALESAAKCVGGDLAIVLGDRAMFARAALARVGGGK